jgi:hypothetical protein
MEHGGCVQAAYGLFVTLHVDGDTLTDVLLGSHTVDTLLHLEVLPVVKTKFLGL